MPSSTAAGSSDFDGLLARVVEVEAEIARLQAVQSSLIASLAGALPQTEEFLLWDERRAGERPVRITDAVREEVAAALRLSPATAQDRIDIARALAGPLQATAEAFAEGRIGLPHVRAMVEAANRLPGAGTAPALGLDHALDHRVACAHLEARVLPVACARTPGDTRRVARRAVLSIDPVGGARRRALARRDRDVWVADEPDGVSVLLARLGTVDAHAILAKVRACAGARSAVDDGRGLRAGEARAEALADLVLRGQLAQGGDAAAAVELQVTVDLATLLGLADEPVGLATAGPIPVEELRDLLEDSRTEVTLRRLATDPVTGHLLDRSPRRYALGADLRAFVTARDHVCRFPGCRRTAARCQIDHAVPYDADGASIRANLGALCTRHHQLKTVGLWRITDSAVDGTATWHSPRGRRYPHAPPPE